MTRVLRAGIHGGEEPIVVGNDRAGLVVFSGCHLSCSFCYTPETSVHRLGIDVDREAFAAMLSKLAAIGAGNINLISPTHVWSAIEPVLVQFRTISDLPMVLKFSGFESPRLIQRFAKLADVLVPDFKVFGQDEAVSVSLPASYGKIAENAMAEMIKTHGGCEWNAEGKMTRGMIVRHLLMPGFETDSEQVIAALARAGYRGHLNLMTCFISSAGRLHRAPPDRVRDLSAQAEAVGMTVLVDAKQGSDIRTNGRRIMA